MTTVDWIIIGIVSLSTVMSLWRGATREIFSLVAWVVGIYLGVKFAARLDGLFTAFIDAQSVRFAAGFVVIFLGVMIAGGLLNRLLSKFISFTGLTVFDRMLGVAFGLARGVLILTVLVVLANYTTLPQDAWWKNSQLLPHFEGIAKQLTEWVEKQGFDPKKLETWMDSVEGKKTPAAKPEEPIDKVLGVPVSKDSADHNVLGAPVPPDSNGNTDSKPNMLGQPVPSAKTNEVPVNN